MLDAYYKLRRQGTSGNLGGVVRSQGSQAVVKLLGRPDARDVFVDVQNEGHLSYKGRARASRCRHSAPNAMGGALPSVYDIVNITAIESVYEMILMEDMMMYSGGGSSRPLANMPPVIATQGNLEARSHLWYISAQEPMALPSLQLTHLCTSLYLRSE